MIFWGNLFFDDFQSFKIDEKSVLVSGEYVNSLGRSLYLVEISDPVVHLLVHTTSYILSSPDLYCCVKGLDGPGGPAVG